MRISLLSIMLNEEALVPRWIDAMRRVDHVFDEIRVIDGGSADGTVRLLEESGISVLVRPFANDFADQRNYGIDHTTGDWILELDADELMSTPLLYGLRTVADCALHDGVDCIGIPRINFHDGLMQPGPGAHHLDYQYRLHRRHCRWKNPVHEEIAGYTARVELEFGEGHFIRHLKTQARHDERNALYARIGG